MNSQVGGGHIGVSKPRKSPDSRHFHSLRSEKKESRLHLLQAEKGRKHVRKTVKRLVVSS